MEGSDAPNEGVIQQIFVDWGDGNSEYITIPEENRGDDMIHENFGHNYNSQSNSDEYPIHIEFQFSDSYLDVTYDLTYKKSTSEEWDESVSKMKKEITIPQTSKRRELLPRWVDGNNTKSNHH